MSVQFITHRGKRIIEADYTACQTKEETFQVLDKLTEYVKDNEGPLLVLSDATFTHLSREFMSKAKRSGKPLQHKVGKSAVLGITGIKKVLLQAYRKYAGSKMTPFDTREEALKYLTAD